MEDKELSRIKRHLNCLENLCVDYEFIIYENDDSEKESFYRNYNSVLGCIDTGAGYKFSKYILNAMNRLDVNEVTFVSKILGITKTIAKSKTISLGENRDHYTRYYDEILNPNQIELMNKFAKEFNQAITDVNKTPFDKITDVNDINMRLTTIVQKYMNNFEKSGITPEVCVRYIRENFGIVLSMQKFPNN